MRDYQRFHEYDQFGRQTVVTEVLSDGNYYSAKVYDGFGRLLSQRFKRGDEGAEKRIGRRYNDYGYLQSVMRGSLVLAETKEQDAAGRATLVELGNGLSQKRTFDDFTGRLVSGTLLHGTEQRLQEGYAYDAIGSVSMRSLHWDTESNGFVELFQYDGLNRLELSDLVGRQQQAVTYHADGAIKSKSGVGSGDYSYPAQGVNSVRPHAVSSIPGIGDFSYDDNGNLLSDSSRTVIWNSFDMPKRITKGTASSDFVYGSEHQRVRQTRGDGTSIIYAGQQEIETVGGETTIKTYWPGGIGLEIEKPGQSVELVWTHADHLGSPIALSDVAGNLKEKLAYDAWGKRPIHRT